MNLNLQPNRGYCLDSATNGNSIDLVKTVRQELLSNINPTKYEIESEYVGYIFGYSSQKLTEKFVQKILR